MARPKEQKEPTDAEHQPPVPPANSAALQRKQNPATMTGRTPPGTPVSPPMDRAVNIPPSPHRPDKVRRKKRCGWICKSLLATITLAVSLVGLLVWRTWPVPALLLGIELHKFRWYAERRNPGPPVDPSRELVRVDLDGWVADIPLNYFYDDYALSGRWWKKGGSREGRRWYRPPAHRQKIGSFDIQMLLPGLQPWTPENAEVFDSSRSKTMRLLLSRLQNPDWPFYFFRHFRSELDLLGPSDEAPGMLHFKDFEYDVFMEQDAPVRGMIRIRCNPTTPVLRCETDTDYRYGGSTYDLSYAFPRSYLPRWRELHGRVVALLDGFAEAAGRADHPPAVRETQEE